LQTAVDQCQCVPPFARKIKNNEFVRKPSFAEFVQYIIDEDLEGKVLDMHWAPVYKYCSPCQVVPGQFFTERLFCFGSLDVSIVIKFKFKSYIVK